MKHVTTLPKIAHRMDTVRPLFVNLYAGMLDGGGARL